jgi:hypothetical protein
VGCCHCFKVSDNKPIVRVVVFPGTADGRQRLRVKVLHDEAKRVVLTMSPAFGQ